MLATWSESARGWTPVASTTRSAGTCQAPKDIPDTVAQAKAAASRAIVELSRVKREAKADSG